MPDAPCGLVVSPAEEIGAELMVTHPEVIIIHPDMFTMGLHDLAPFLAARAWPTLTVWAAIVAEL